MTYHPLQHPNSETAPVSPDYFEELVKSLGSTTEARRQVLRTAAALEKKAETRRLNSRHAGRGSDRERRALDYADALEDRAAQLIALLPQAVDGCSRCGEPRGAGGAYPEDHRCHPDAPLPPPAAYVGSVFGS